MLAENKIVDMDADRLRSHYLVGLLVCEHTVLMYPRLMRKGIFADYRLIERSGLTDYVVYSLTRTVDLRGVDACSETCHVLSCAYRHYDLFERSIACSLSEAVDSALHLPCPSEHSGESVDWLIDEMGVVFDAGVVTSGTSPALRAHLTSNGGGPIMVPTFRLIGGLPAVVSSATSLFVVVPTGVAGVLRHLRAGTCRIPIGLAAGIAGACTSVLGTKLADIAPGWVIMVAAAAVVLYSATTMLRSALRDGRQAPVKQPAPAPSAEQTATTSTAGEGDKPAATPDRSAATQTTRKQILMAVGIGLLAGPLSGFVGVGGGFLMIPLFVTLLHFDMRTAAGTSLLGVFCLATPAAISQSIMGNVSYLVGIPVAIGSIFGTAIGKRIAAHMSDRALKIAFSVLLAVAAVLLVVNEF